ncbi:MAG: Fic family protein [Candidatus Dadabacteria bacterium]|nr:Fic family protein [Candidatus Dadabacteria bacterium]
MKLPLKPPPFEELFPELINSGKYMELSKRFYGNAPKKYLHWDQLRHRQVPEGLTLKQWRSFIKTQRVAASKNITLPDKQGKPFNYNMTESISQVLHGIDMESGGSIQIEDKDIDPHTRDRYIIRSLIEEAITSSQIEGASTTRLVAKNLIQTGRKPRDRSEEMILNNYRAMESIRRLKNEPLTQELVFNIHEIITRGTLDEPTAAGRFRKESEDIKVYWSEEKDTLVHVPPPASELPWRMKKMCEFANAKDDLGFIHPAIRSIILHFWLAYDHPFFDGNGRTARALFYWSMLHHGYWLFEFISISEIILKGRAQYVKAFLYTETDGNDLNYFITYHLRVIRRAVKSLHDYIARRTGELKELESQVKSLALLNHRQRDLIGSALRHPNRNYTVKSHQTVHSVVHQTARTDLFELVEMGLLEKRRLRRSWVFEPVAGLEEALGKL